MSESSRSRPDDSFDLAAVHGALKLCGVEIRDEGLLTRVFTHDSYRGDGHPESESNEELEFLGDAVLGLVVGEYLIGRGIRREGRLTGFRSLLVRNTRLARIAGDLDLGELMRLSRGEVMAGGRQKPRLLSGLLEALVAAMYVEGGLEQAERFIYDFVLKGTDQIADWELADPKSRINEYFQKNFQTVPLYAVRDLTGHDHERRFKVVVCKPNAEVLAWGEGKSKKEAEEDAALNALEELQNLVQS